MSRGTNERVGADPPFAAQTMPEDADQKLSFAVNIVGVVVFSAVVLYHFIVASPKDAEE